MAWDFAGRTVVVTGGESGIGRAIAREFALLKAHVFVGDFQLLAENRRDYEQLGINSQFCDVRQEDAVARLIDQAAAATGRLDALVNNAGVRVRGQITDVTAEQWDASMETNVRGAFFGCKHAIPHLRRQGGGAIVNIASNAGLLPRAHDPVYCISKYALVGLTRSLALCHSVDQIRINAVCPGPVGDTGMVNDDLKNADDPELCLRGLIDASPIANALGRVITPLEVAQAVLYLASDAALFVTGTCIAIDGGKSLGVPPEGRS